MHSRSGSPNPGTHPGGCCRFISTMRKPDLYDGLVAIGVLLYAIIFSFLSLIRYNTFQLEYDLAVFNQAFWNTVMHGELLTNSLEQFSHNMAVGSHMGVHFSPILFSLIPFYALSPTPQTLLIAQSVLLALGAIPIYLCGREFLGKGAGCAVAALYFLYPALHGVNLYDFHEVAFLPLFIGFTLWGFVSGRRNLMLVFGLLSLLIKEDVSLIVGMIGLVGLFQTRSEPLVRRWHFLALIGMAVLSFLLFYFVIQPVFIPTASAMGSGFLHQYVNPVETASQGSGYRVDYVIQVLAPLLFVPLAAPEIILIGIPSFLEILLSGSVYFSIYYHYSALIIPVIFIATIIALLRVKAWEEHAKKQVFIPVICLMLLSSVICMGMYSPAAKLVGSQGGYSEEKIGKHRVFVEQVISLIPKEASIATQYNLLPQVSSREQIWVDYHDGADVIILDTAFAWRAKDFADNQKQIDEGYDLVLKKEYVLVYVNKDNPSLKSALAGSFSSV